MQIPHPESQLLLAAEHAIHAATSPTVGLMAALLVAGALAGLSSGLLTLMVARRR